MKKIYWFKKLAVQQHFLGQSEYTAHFGLGKEGIEMLYSVRIKWLAEKSTSKTSTKSYEETYYNVPTRTTLHVHRRSLNKHLIHNTSHEVSLCTVFNSDNVDNVVNDESIAEEAGEGEDSLMMRTKSNKNNKLSTERDLYLKLIDRYRRAISFFQEKIDTVDSVLLKAKEKSISGKQLLEMLENKYPFVAKERAEKKRMF